LSSTIHFIVTKQHRRFAEFCDACRQYRYIGLCYGPPGVGKTLSARHYTNWDKVEAYHPYGASPDEALKEVQGSDTVFYTPPVLTSPKEIEREINFRRHTLHTIRVEPIHREETTVREDLKRREEERQNRLWEVGWLDAPQEEPLKPSWAEVSRTYHQKRIDAPDPTSLVIIDETDRLKMSGLEQVRDIFDKGGIGLVLIGMPGIEKRLSRYPQLYSRVGFVHAFQPLKADEVRGLLRKKWSPSGISLPENGIAEETMAAIIRITGGNFRLLHRLLTQIERLIKINELEEITPQVVEAARENLVIGVSP
jgi:DNA transposition AAA+ family ATPase